ncbi:PAS domain-containing protein [Maridesulfovibrio sp.]|uniref:PAS domain-containing protein n=1 Tax=unclassified Maridesulfovibrio TaxID=2794999 RepID=UPI003AFFFD70
MADQLQVLIDNIQEGVVVFREGHLEYCNESFIRFMGYSSLNQLLSFHFTEFIHPEDLDLARSYHEQRESGVNNIARYEIRLVDRYGKTFWVEVSGNKIFWNGTAAVLNTFIDISKRKNFEAELAKSDKKYEDIVSKSPIGIFRSTPKGKYLYLNDRFAQMLGYEKHELFEADFNIQNLYVDPEARNEIKFKLTSVGELYNHHIHLRRKDGYLMWMAIFVKTGVYEEGLYYDGFTLDITKKKNY